MQPATYADLPAGVRAEVLDGVIVTTPEPRPSHAGIMRRLAGFIGGPLDERPDRWCALIGVDVLLTPNDVVRPMVAGCRREQVRWGVRSLDGAPELICEIASPNSAYKRRLCATHGVRFYWVVDPDGRTLEALRLENGQRRVIGTYDDAAVARIAPFDERELAVGRLFPPQ